MLILGICVCPPEPETTVEATHVALSRIEHIEALVGLSCLPDIENSRFVSGTDNDSYDVDNNLVN